jgi:hypothetical protein
MGFRLRPETKRWFRHFEKDSNAGIKIDFDMYYLCVMVGFHFGKKNLQIENKNAPEFFREFPNAYIDEAPLIIAILLSKELQSLKVGLEEKDAMNKQISKLINRNGLSDYGMELLNQYSYYGFDKLREHFPSEPQIWENFLVDYLELFKGAREGAE